jgi:anthranilate synthase
MSSQPPSKKQKTSPPSPSKSTNADFTPTMGAPRFRPSSGTFSTKGGVLISRQLTLLTTEQFVTESTNLVKALDERRGCIFESSYEYPGRYARWTMGFVDPPIAFEGRGLYFDIQALNSRGTILLPAIFECLQRCRDVESIYTSNNRVKGCVRSLPEGSRFSEEQRSKQPSIFSVVRELTSLFGLDTAVDPQLGLYGSFGYDLTFQFEKVKEHHKREIDENGIPIQRDLLLYLPDSIIVLDGPAKDAYRMDYEFDWNGVSTRGKKRIGEATPFSGVTNLQVRRDHKPGEYSKKVERAREEFRVGNLFECVLSQVFYEPCAAPPSEILNRLRERNPSPYMFIINLGLNEHLVGASPEMFVRCEHTPNGIRVETCPISGTIKRGDNALEDAERIKEILTNKKEESELTMCTDVDRNDKSRICIPGSVRVIGRRQIEKYSKLIHTVDHVEGYLRNGFDALDAFLCHTWAVTVTGAPKPWAIQFVENHEETPRKWYAGAVGLIGFDGHLNTGLTLRTIHIQDGVASVRAGATLLYDSDPLAEEKETELKASAFRDAILTPSSGSNGSSSSTGSSNSSTTEGILALTTGTNKKIVVVDHQDSFVHTLGNYLRQTGANVETVRFGISKKELNALSPDLVVLSPGPGKPSDFNLSRTINMCIELKIPVFGVCLGLQGIVEHFGGTLGVLDYPMHGKPSLITVSSENNNGGGGEVFFGVPKQFTVARYHSLYATSMPEELRTTAATDEGIVMGVQHKTLPIAAVQFHPESILTSPAVGLRMLANVVGSLTY